MEGQKMNFNDFKLDKLIINAIDKLGYNEPTEIQKLAIPPILEGKDIIGLAQTGTGKTAAFALPIINKLINNNDDTHKLKVLILCPTRELAVQNKDNIIKYSNGTNLKCNAILGGENIRKQIQLLKNGLDILVATPGRLVDLINQNKVNLSNINILVLDEADTMLDMGFIKDINKIISMITEDRQTLLFSATMSKEILSITNKYMKKPLTIKTSNADLTIDKIDQEVCYIDTPNKLNIVLELLSTKDKPSTLIFTRTKHGADKLSKELESYNIKTSVIHSNKRQSNRAKALSDFKKGITQVLIATDIASRGIDINDLKLVINYELPEQAEVYIHRIGRTARAGKEGKAITLCSSGEVSELKAIEKLIKMRIKVMENSKYPMILKEDKPGRKKHFIKNNQSTDKEKIYQNKEIKTKKENKYYHKQDKDYQGNHKPRKKHYQQEKDISHGYHRNKKPFKH
jgi:ATP-dependent RNA helicase RhlE